MRARPRGTVYVDFLQNILGKTLATAYSARASEFAGVSTPLTWKEVDAGVDPHDFTIVTAPARFRESRRSVGAAADGEAGESRSGVPQVCDRRQRRGAESRPLRYPAEPAGRPAVSALARTDSS